MSMTIEELQYLMDSYARSIAKLDKELANGVYDSNPTRKAEKYDEYVSLTEWYAKLEAELKKRRTP